MKTRSRLPYLLSNTEATLQQPNAMALLTTTRGTVGDTSVANLIMVDNKGRLVSPPKGDILTGCTLQAFDRLLRSQNISIEYRDIDPLELRQATEVLLTGSSGGVWFASSLDGHPIGTDSIRPKYNLLSELWRQYVGFNFVTQAAQSQLDRPA